MIEKFVRNRKSYLLFSILIISYYFLSSHFTRNYYLINSSNQLIFFISYFIFLPLLIGLLVSFVLKNKTFELKSKLTHLSMLIFILICIQLFNFNFFISIKRILFLMAITSFYTILIFKYQFNHKYLILILVFMSFFSTFNLGKRLYKCLFKNQTNWSLLKEDIQEFKLKNKPNVYYIQPDGYANSNTLKNSLYNYNNEAFDNWLAELNFTHYPDFKSNYHSTLLSNSSCLNLKHHNGNAEFYFNSPRDFIIGKNNVNSIFKKNNYRTYFVSERPYLLANHPTDSSFDFLNFDKKELSHLNDNFETEKDISQALKKELSINRNSSKFFFIELFSPGHIPHTKEKGNQIAKHRSNYLKKIKTANLKLKKIIQLINSKDPNSIIIISADHGGYVGFNYSLEGFKKTNSYGENNSIFGSKLAIKWSKPNSDFNQYDIHLKSSVNLFRILFSYLCQDKSFLKNLEHDNSFLPIDNDNDVFPKFDQINWHQKN